MGKRGVSPAVFTFTRSGFDRLKRGTGIVGTTTTKPLKQFRLDWAIR